MEENMKECTNKIKNTGMEYALGKMEESIVDNG